MTDRSMEEIFWSLTDKQRDAIYIITHMDTEDRRKRATRIKLFTRNDIDGATCAALTRLAFGEDNVDVEYCDTDEFIIDEKILSFAADTNVLRYNKVFIVGLTVSYDVARFITGLNVQGWWNLINRFSLDERFKELPWCYVDTRYDDDIPSYDPYCSATYNIWLMDEGYYNELSVKTYRCASRFSWDIIETAYYTGRLNMSYKLEAEGELVYHVYHSFGRDFFIDWAVKTFYYGRWRQLQTLDGPLV